MRRLLREQGPMTVGEIIRHRPIRGGLEELVAHVRVARAVDAVVLDKEESLLVPDRKGAVIKATVPGLMMTADKFPTDLEELAL
jgi:hypothetical protein